jgi:SAM-dependent methyltransferase
VHGVSDDRQVDGAATFRAGASAYELLVGRYSPALAVAMADVAGVRAGQRALDVGCGPGALVAELVRRLGTEAVVAVDPSPPMVAEARARHPGVDVREGRAEALPFEDASVDVALAQLVLHFVSEPDAALAELRRVVRPGGVVVACVWDFGAGGMRVLAGFWQAAMAVDPDAPDEARTMRFARDGEIAALFAAGGLHDVVAGALDVEAPYTGFDDLWAGFLGGAGPAGAYAVAQTPERQAAIRDELRARLAVPDGPFTLPARAWYGLGRV